MGERFVKFPAVLSVTFHYVVESALQNFTFCCNTFNSALKYSRLNLKQIYVLVVYELEAVFGSIPGHISCVLFFFFCSGSALFCVTVLKLWDTVKDLGSNK